MALIRTFLFYFLLWLSLLLSTILFIVFPLFLLPGTKKFRRKYISFWTRNWSRMAISLSGSKVIAEGIENIPVKGSFAIISNHQGYMDIPVLISVFPGPLSFVAKKEILYLPFLNFWLLAQECIWIDRKKPLRSYRKIEKRLRDRPGNPLIIFPEGTRSRSAEEKPWKQGGLRLLERAGIPVVYVKIMGTYKIWEEKNRIMPAEIHVKISGERIQ